MVLMSMFLLLLVLFNAVPHASSKPIPKSDTYLKNLNNNTDNNSQNNENNDAIDASENIENVIEDIMEDLDINGDNVLDSNFSAEVLKEKEDDKEEEVENIEKNETTKLDNADEDGSANLLFFFKTTSASPEVIDIHPEKVKISLNDSVSVSDSNVEVSVNSSSGTEEDFDLATTNVKLESSEEGSSVNETSSLIEQTMKNFRDLKAEIEIREGHLRDLLIKHIGSKELLKIENLLEELDDKVIVPYENQLKAFGQQITDSKDSLKDARTYIPNAEKFLQSTRDRLNEVDEKVANFTNGLIEQAMKKFEDLKAEIDIREGHLRDLLITNVGNKDLHQLENLLEELEAKVIVPYENQLKTFKEQNTDSNDDALNYITSVEKFLQTSRNRLDEVDEKVATFYNRDQEIIVTKTAETKSYEALLKEKIASDHIKAHDQEDDDTSEDTVEASSSIYKFLVPGLALLAFILFCLLVVYKITKKKTRTGGQISKGMVGDVGYTELDVKIDADHWDPRDGGRRYQKFK